MATDFNKPVVTDAYAGILPGLVTAQQDLARMLEPTLTGTSTNIPTGAVRWNAGTSKWERYGGSSWGNLATTYAISISGNAATATSATTATKLAAGVAGAIPYQSAAGTTAFTAVGTAGQVLVSGAAAAPIWVSQSTLSVGSAATAGSCTGNAATATTAGTCTGNAATATLAEACSGNAATVTNGVYTTGNRSIGGSTYFGRSFAGTPAYNNYIVSIGGEGGTAAVLNFHSVGATQCNLYLPAGSSTLTTDASFTSAGNVTAYSDERVKTNWREFGPNFVNQLSGIKSGIYDRTDVELTQVGVSAQSLQGLMPHAVLEDTDGKLSVSYGNAALAACVELAKYVVGLEARIADLEGK